MMSLPGRTSTQQSKVSRSSIALAAIALLAITIIPFFHFYPTSSHLSAPIFEPRVCAFYYTWYGNQTPYPGEFASSASSLLHWDESHPEADPPIFHNPMVNIWDTGTANHPVLNQSWITLYDSYDPDAMKFHMDCAEYAGIDTFITTWWGPGNYVDHNFHQLLNVTRDFGYDMEHTVYFETVTDRYNMTKPWGLTNLINDMEYVLTKYGNHSNFLRLNGRPVIFIYATTSTQPISNWSVAVSRLHDDGFNPFLIADLGLRAPPEDWRAVFDGFHGYNPLGDYVDEWPNVLPKTESLVHGSRLYGKLSCSTVLPGYNDTQVRHNVPVLKRFDGNTYRRAWDVAYKAQPDWVLICTFNEWHEGTEIEPSIENGTFYIDATRIYTGLFHG